jgi:hypothetical protein
MNCAGCGDSSSAATSPDATEDEEDGPQPALAGMTQSRLQLVVLPGRLAVCRLALDEAIPEWATQARFSSITRTAEELSIVCPESTVPEEVESSGACRALRVAGVIDLSAVGVLARLSTPLAQAGIPLFALSTFDTHYLLVREPDLIRAVDVLRSGGWSLLELDL